MSFADRGDSPLHDSAIGFEVGDVCWSARRRRHQSFWIGNRDNGSQGITKNRCVDATGTLLLTQSADHFAVMVTIQERMAILEEYAVAGECVSPQILTKTCIVI